jgi:N-acetylglucosamine-6-phosphate deacetylase
MEAVQMATYNPAKIINIDDRKGSILVGKDADLAVIDQDLNVYATFLEGSIIYDNL